MIMWLSRRLEDGDQVIFIEYDLLKWKDLEWGDSSMKKKRVGGIV